MDRTRYNEEAARIIEDRIKELRFMTFAEVATRPETSSEDQLIAGEKASVTVFRQDSPYQLDGRVLVTVLVAKSGWFGMTSYHIERGLVFSPGEQVREATETELQNSGG
jgi:hypothetical protein